ncbi:Lipoprotein LpqB [Austwickia sp. TVS 96-490-7B]|uniref:GerMN domain-containing protein n=1 Tax=Austwickia sp. TVS 96-490-7B TaxID=2830843 RepID=UPI001C592D77|nr:GerMN domain-containing protein [Austwickia sp. TVS 96-490-7B]MBW3086785.1 Lipoprotein LpqB [Austwickia sp. TVS 96-490-7B]
MRHTSPTRAAQIGRRTRPMWETWRRRGVAAVLALGVVTATTGCAGLPDRSEPMQGNQVGAPIMPPVRQHLPGPADGAGPESIVFGFVTAGSATTDDYSAARHYLTGALPDSWAPRSRTVQIFATDNSLSAQRLSTDDSTVTIRLTGAMAATVDADGRYHELPAPRQHTADFRLTKTNGQWRIAHLPDDFGIWLDAFYFNRTYQPFLVQYSAPSARTLIPDRRFFPVTQSLSTSLARALLEPVPDYLRGAVTTGFPDSTRLSVDAVTVNGGTAQVDLTSAALGSGAEERRAALAQAVATLTQATAVTQVSLQVDGRPLAVVGAPGEPREASELGYTTAPEKATDQVVVRQGAALIPMSANALRAGVPLPPGGSLPSINSGFSEMSIAPDLKDIAATSSDGRGMLRWRQDPTSGATTSTVLPAFGTGLVRPSYDAKGSLWTAGVDPHGASMIWVVDTRGEVSQALPRPLSTPWLSGRAVSAIAAATDGQRLAVIMKDSAGRTTIGVCGVLRGPDDRPTGLTAPLMIGGSIVSATSVTWQSAYQLAVLGKLNRNAEPRPLTIGLDGRTDGADLPVVQGAVSVLALGSGRLGVVTNQGRLWLSVAGGWQDTLAATDAVAP